MDASSVLPEVISIRDESLVTQAASSGRVFIQVSGAELKHGSVPPRVKVPHVSVKASVKTGEGNSRTTSEKTCVR